MAPGKKLPTKLVSIRVHWWLALPWQPKGRAACHERNGSRESARAAELSRRLADCLARFLASHRLGDPARAAAGDFAIRAGLPSRDGPKPDRGLVAETSYSALCQCDPADARAGRYYHYHHRFCHSPANQANTGTGAKCAKYVARDPQPDRIGHAKLP